MGVAKNIRLGLHRLGLAFAALPPIVGVFALGSQEVEIYQTAGRLAAVNEEAAALTRGSYEICEREILEVANRTGDIYLKDAQALANKPGSYCRVTDSNERYGDLYTNTVKSVVLATRMSRYEQERAVRSAYLPIGAAIAAMSLLIYGLFYLFGWILSGFFGE